MFSRFAKILLAAAMTLLAGCTRTPDAGVMDGDGMEYDFTRYQLVGEWTEYGNAYPWKLTFIENSMRWTGPSGEDGSMDFVLEDNGSDVHRILTFSGENKPFDALLFRQIAVNGWNVNCLFQLDEDGSVIRLFVKDTDVYLMPDDYLPDPEDGEIIAEGETEVRQIYLATDALDTLKWLGKTPEETHVSPQYMDRTNIPFDGYLFGSKVHGTAWCLDVYNGITMYSADLSYEKAAAELADLYGEGKPFTEPYVDGEGITEGLVFTHNICTVTLQKSSEQEGLQILAALLTE